MVVVHGGGKAVTKQLESRGLEAKFINGLRVTDANTIEAVDEVLNGKVNGEVAEFVSSYDCEVQPCLKRNSPAKNLIRTDLGFVGAITKVDTAPIKKALEDGLMPIISSTASDENGQCYNKCRHRGRRGCHLLGCTPSSLPIRCSRSASKSGRSKFSSLQSAGRPGRFAQKRRYHRQRNAAQGKQCRGCP